MTSPVSAPPSVTTDSPVPCCTLSLYCLLIIVSVASQVHVRRADSRASPPLSPFPEFISLGSAETALYPAPRAKSPRERGEQGKDGWPLLTESLLGKQSFAVHRTPLLMVSCLCHHQVVNQHCHLCFVTEAQRGGVFACSLTPGSRSCHDGWPLSLREGESSSVSTAVAGWLAEKLELAFASGFFQPPIHPSDKHGPGTVLSEPGMQETQAQSAHPPHTDSQGPATHSESAFPQNGQVIRQVIRQPATVYKALLSTTSGTRTLPSWSLGISGRETDTNKEI